MQVSLKGTNITILDSVSEYVDRKLVRTVEKFLLARRLGLRSFGEGGSLGEGGIKDEEPVSLSIEVERTTRHHRKGKIFRAEANLSAGKKSLYAEAFGETLNEAIDLLKEALEQEIKKFKGKRRALMLKGARKLKGGS